MIVQAIKEFRDLESGTLRKGGDRFEVTPERFAALNSSRYGELVREVEAPRGKSKTTKKKG